MKSLMVATLFVLVPTISLAGDLECKGTAQGITCTGKSIKLAPAEAAALLKLSVPQFEGAPELHAPPGLFVIAEHTAGSGPFGAFSDPGPRLRLDGTLLTDPPVVYGFNPLLFSSPFALGGAPCSLYSSAQAHEPRR